MRLFDSRTHVEVIERSECVRLLDHEVVGRLGILEGGSPLVLPVNYALDGERVVIRTGPGSKLSAARSTMACFEVDDFDRETRSGWSVVVRGRLEEVTAYDSVALAAIEDLAEPWLEGERPHVLRLLPTSITGRRVPVRRHDRDDDARPHRPPVDS